MADQNQIADWLDAPDETQAPDFSNAKTAADWLEAPDKTASPPSFKTDKQASDFLEAPEEPASHNILTGVEKRGLELGAGLTRFVGQTAETLGDPLATAMPSWLGGISKEEAAKENTPLLGWAREMEAKAKDLNYQPSVPFETLKQQPSVGNILTFLGEQGITSVPDIVGLVTNPLAYGAGLTGDIAQQRAVNKGLKEPGMREMLEASPAAAVSVLLQRFGLGGPQGVLARLGQASAARGLTAAAAKEAAAKAAEAVAKTEAGRGIGYLMAREAGANAAQAEAQYAGETVGTNQPWSPEQAADIAAQAGIAGGVIGAGIRGKRLLSNGRPVPEPVPAPGPMSESAGTGASPPIGTVFGLKNPDGSVTRGVVEGVEGGHVLWRTEDGIPQANTIDEFARDMAPPPPPSGAMSNATLPVEPLPDIKFGRNSALWAVPEPPAHVTEPAPWTAADLGDLHPGYEELLPVRQPMPAPPQQAMALPDTTAIDTTLAAARTLRKNAAEAQRIADTGASVAKSPEEIALMHRQAESLEADALQQQRDLAARRTGPVETLPPIDTEAARLGQLGRNVPTETEATTGQSLTEPGRPAKAAEIQRLQAETPLLQAAPPRSEATEGPNVAPERPTAGLGELGRNVPVESEATTGRQQTAPGTPGRTPRPLDINQAIAAAGGIKDETAARYDNTAAGRAKKRGGELDFLYTYPEKGSRRAASTVVPGKGPRSIINSRSGMAPDYMREHLTQIGYLPEGATVDDMYARMRDTHGGNPQFSVHGPNSDINDVVAMQEAQQHASDLDRAAASAPYAATEHGITSGDRWFGPEPTMEDLEAFDSLISPDMLRAIKAEPHEEILNRLDEAAGPEVAAVAKEGTHSGDINERPFAEGNPPAERLPPRGQEQEAHAGTARPGEEGGGTPATMEPVAARSREPVTERTPEGEQGVMPGMERSAVQAAAARPERLRGEGEQKPADEGLFAAPEDTRQLGLEQAAGSQTFRSKTEEFSQHQPERPINERAADWVISEGQKSGQEELVAYDSNGKLIDVGQGSDGNSVGFSPEISRALEDPNGAVNLVHNHTNGTPLSDADITVLGTPGGREVSSFTHAGDVSRAALTESAAQSFAGLQPYEAVLKIEEITGHADDLSDMAVAANVGRNIDSQELRNRLLAAVGLIEYQSSHKSPLAGLAREAEVMQHLTNNLANRMKGLGHDFAQGYRQDSAHDGAYPNTSTVSPHSRVGEVPSEVGGNEGQRPVAQSEGEGRLQDQERPEQRPTDVEGQKNGLEQRGGIEPERGTKLAAGFDPVEAGRQIKSVIQEVGAKIKLSAKKEGTAPEIAKAAISDLPPKPPVGGPDLRSIGAVQRILSFASTVASHDPVSADYYVADLNRERFREHLERDGGTYLTKYARLPKESIDRVNKILEHDRLTGFDRKDTGRRAVARMPENYTGRLAKPGEIVSLSPAETAGLNELRQFFDKRLGEIGEAMAHRFGYQGEFTPQAMQAAIDAASHPRERTAAMRAQEVYQMINDARRTGYVPFQRYGDHYIKVTPKPGYEPGKDNLQTHQPAWFEMLETKTPLGNLFGSSGRNASKMVADRLGTLRKEYPPEKFDYEHGAVTPKLIDSIDVPAMEKLFMLISQNDPKLSDTLYDQVMTKVYQEARAGFKKQANNIPGYSTDFERAIADYVRQSSSVVANTEMGRTVEQAFEATQRHTDRNIRDYWAAYKNHLEAGGNDYARLRQLGFFQFLWGSPGAAIANLTQTPLVTSMQLGAWAGPRAVTLAHGALGEALAAVRPGRRGLELNWDRLGRTPGEKSMLAKLRSEGVTDPAISQDLQGADASRNQNMRPLLKKVQRVYDIGASGFNVSEQANRIAAALSGYRAAQDPVLMAKAQKVHAKDEVWQQMVGPRGTPTDVARFMVDETQFVGGKRGRTPIMRGPGAVLFQFKQYPANYFRLLNKNFTQMGPEGKMAGTLMLAGLGAGSGLIGEPFVEDAEKLFEAAYKGATGIDPMLNYRIAQWARDAGWGELGAEALLHGVSRAATGTDLGNRIGMGNMAPELQWGNLAPLLAATVGRGQEAYQRWQSGQPLGALATAAQAVAGKGPSDVIRAIGQLPNEGYQTRYGDLVVPPSQVTPGEQVSRSLGLQPAEFARQSEFRQTEKRLKSATQEASTQMLTTIAKNFALADDARRSGKSDLARSYDLANDQIMAANRQQLEDAGIPDWRKVPPASRTAIKSKVRAMLDFEGSAIKSAGKGKRGAMEDYPLPR